MDSKEYYRTGKHSHWTQAPMRQYTMREIVRMADDKILEFGCGRGENLAILKVFGYDVRGIEINPDEVQLATRRRLNVIEGDETAITQFNAGMFDVSFTMGVMDHLDEGSFQSAVNYLTYVTKKTIFCLETNEEPGDYYYPHDYEMVGFKKVKDFQNNEGDKALYTLWRQDVNA